MTHPGDGRGRPTARHAGENRSRAPPKWGDVVLRIVAGLVLLYLFLPIFVIILFSFNKPAGKFNYTWQGFTLENWADPFKYPALTEALKLSLNVAAVSTADRARPRHPGRDRACAPTVPGQRRRSTPSWCCR